MLLKNPGAPHKSTQIMAHPRIMTYASLPVTPASCRPWRSMTSLKYLSTILTESCSIHQELTFANHSWPELTISEDKFLFNTDISSFREFCLHYAYKAPLKSKTTW